MGARDQLFLMRLAVVVVLLHVVLLGFFFMTRSIGANTEKRSRLDDQAYHALVARQVKPFVQVAIAGEDNSALQISDGDPQTVTPVVASIPADGKSAYEAGCAACHGAGIGGAPRFGESAQWTARIAQGAPTLYRHAIEGYTGSQGVMPAKGGRADWPDAIVRAAVDYMVDASTT